MRPNISFRSLRTVAIATLLPGLGACGLLDSLEDDGALVNMFVSHHATPSDGEFPNYGVEEAPRRFTNDQGWEITLAEAYVTVSAVQVMKCAGGATLIDLYWGPCAEDFIRVSDTNPVGIGGAQVPAANYCQIGVLFGPFDFVAAQTGDQTHDVPDNELVDGTSVYLRGQASKGEETVNFEWSTSKTLEVYLDISTIENGGPVVIKHDEDFPQDLTIGKPYDAFFEGIDFADYSDKDLEATVLSSLEFDTRAHFGAGVLPETAAQ
jgi:hypothetical protein